VTIINIIPYAIIYPNNINAYSIITSTASTINGSIASAIREKKTIIHNSENNIMLIARRKSHPCSLF
jgi:hypothetical protein